MQKRFRKTQNGHTAEVWVDVGIFRFRAELYENGEFVDHQKGPKPSREEVKVHISGKEFSALLHLLPDGTMRCTWSR